MKLMPTLLASAAALMIGAGSAFAATAVASNDLNVRSGPGTQYPVVSVIPQGESVTASGCNGSWCRVDYRGVEGWASRNFLGGAGSGSVATYAVTGGPSYGYGNDYAYGNGYGYGYPAYAYDYSDPYYDDGYYGAPLLFGFGGGYGGYGYGGYGHGGYGHGGGFHHTGGSHVGMGGGMVHQAGNFGGGAHFGGGGHFGGGMGGGHFGGGGGHFGGGGHGGGHGGGARH